MRKRLLGMIFVTGLIAACGEQAEPEESAEHLADRRAAYRQACVARDLLANSEDDMATLEGLAAPAGADALGSIGARAAQSALEFSRAYHRHAELRSAAYANLDSAANHSTTTADSARFARRAESFSIRAPQPGSIEENVFRSYQTDFVSLLQDEDYPCNWDLPF